MVDLARFQNACDRVIDQKRQKSGIGTLGEKTLHAVLKHYTEADPNCHEVKIGPYVADIFNGDGITEIQTRNFTALRKKLAYFLEEHRVHIVYPVPALKWLSWIDPETAEASARRKSPKRWQPYHALLELYWIRPYLLHDNIQIRVILMEMEEYRVLNGWSKDKKRGSTRFDRIPLSILEEVEIKSGADYIKLIPAGLPDEFTAKDFQKTAGMNPGIAARAISVLCAVGVVKHIRNHGRQYVYQCICEMNQPRL